MCVSFTSDRYQCSHGRKLDLEFTELERTRTRFVDRRVIERSRTFSHDGGQQPETLPLRQVFAGVAYANDTLSEGAVRLKTPSPCDKTLVWYAHLDAHVI